MDRPVPSIKVLIVDDEALARNLMNSLIRRDPGLELVGSCSDGAEARREILRLKPDLVFLDIHMPKLNGVEVIESLAKMEQLPYVVFVTAFDQYAVRAFDVDALDYLMKPVDEERFQVAVERARNAIQQRRLQSLGAQIAELSGDHKPAEAAEEATHLIVKKGEELIRLPAADIVWLEAASQYVRIHTRNNTYMMAESLNNYHRRLPGSLFTRIHRSAVVNRARLSRIFKKPNGVHALELDDGTVLSLARSRRKMLNELLASCPQESAVQRS